MLPLSEILRIRDTVDAGWCSPVADAVGGAWGLPSGSARWLRSSSTHVFLVQASALSPCPVLLRFAPSPSRHADGLIRSAGLMATWAKRGLPVVPPLPTLAGRLTEVLPTPAGAMAAMLVPAAVGDEVSVEELTDELAGSWGSALARLHRDGSADAAEVRFPEQLDSGPIGGHDALARAIRHVEDAVARLDHDLHARGICHGDFELDNLRFGQDGPLFFDADEAGVDWFAADVAMAVRDLTGVTLNSEPRPKLLAAFLAGYRRERPFSEQEEAGLVLHSLAASARLLRQLDGVLDTGDGSDVPTAVQELHDSIRKHEAWHRQRLLGAHAAAENAPRTGGIPMAEWWYNNKTGEVEEGPKSLGPDRDGPFASRDEAERAPEIARERARRWAEEEARGN